MYFCQTATSSQVGTVCGCLHVSASRGEWWSQRLHGSEVHNSYHLYISSKHGNQPGTLFQSALNVFLVLLSGKIHLLFLKEGTFELGKDHRT